MTLDTKNISADKIRQLIAVIQSKYSEPSHYNHARDVLLSLGVLDEALRIQDVRARSERRRWQCNAVVSQKERALSDEWFWLKLKPEGAVRLEDWLIGQVIGTIEADVLVVTLGDHRIPVMSCDYAETVVFSSLDGLFMIKRDSTDNMVISAFQRHAHYRR